MNGRTGGSGKFGAIGRMLLVIVIVVVALLVQPTPAAAYRVEEVAMSESSGTLAAVQALLGRRQAELMVYLDSWPVERVERLHVWLQYGIKFEGPWAPDELALVLVVLDAFGATYGEARFADLARTAIGAASFGLLHNLRLVRVEGYRIPVAIFYGWSGRINFTDGLFDDEFLRQNYSWSFLAGEYAHPGPELTTRHVIIGHELGHVVIDGLRAEGVQAGLGRRALDTLYAQTIERAQWPHRESIPAENLATEMAAWALSIGRTPQVDALRATISQSFLTTVITGRPEPIVAGAIP